MHIQKQGGTERRTDKSNVTYMEHICRFNARAMGLMMMKNAFAFTSEFECMRTQNTNTHMHVNKHTCTATTKLMQLVA